MSKFVVYEEHKCTAFDKNKSQFEGRLPVVQTEPYYDLNPGIQMMECFKAGAQTSKPFSNIDPTSQQ